MQRNKIVWIIIFILLAVLGFLVFKNIVLEKKLDNTGRLVNNLNIERDFEIYQALTENNVAKIKENLELNFMFHIKPIETDGLKNMLEQNSIKRLCAKYEPIKTNFLKEYGKNYPSFIKEINTVCDKHNNLNMET